MTGEAGPPDRRLLGRWTPWIAGTVLLAAVVAAFALWRATGRDREPADLDDAFVYDVDRYRVVPPERIGYREVACFETGLVRAAAVAVAADGGIFAAGDDRVVVLSPEGDRRAEIPVEGKPCALAVSPGGGLHLATEDRVFRGPLSGPLAELLRLPGDRARITSIAVDRDSVWVADAGSRGVWRFGLDGVPRGRIGDRDPDRGLPGFNVPSPYFDLLVAPDGLLRIVDPGRHRIDAFTVDGHRELSWGEASFALEGFSGCCNPAHLALLPDGSFVTSEKGIPRVKVYDASGSFVTAVVGSDGLDTEVAPCDVAADSRGRIVLLDPGRGRVRVFAPRRQAGTGD